MKHLFRLLLATLLLTVAQTSAQSRLRIPAKGAECEKWVAGAFAKGKVPPFSFVYGGVPSGKTIANWKYTVETLPATERNVTEHVYTYTDPATGLAVECRVKTFADFNAMEWVLRFRNASEGNTPKIEQVKVVDITPESTAKGAYLLHYADGSHVSKADFHARTRELAVGDVHSMHPQGGRSSSHAFPFFNVQLPTGGMVVAIGWTGNWRADIARPAANTVSVATGMKNLAAYLLPGEEIRTPSTAMLLWQGDDRMDGQNLLRRFLLAHHHPTADGKPAVFPICSSFNYGDPAPCNEYTCMTADYATALVKRYKQFDLLPQVFWLDAGWYSKAADWKNHYNWANTVGNWSVDSVRFPQGLGPVADEVHRAGCKFMVWFEPERVMKDSDWAMQHPEFMLDASGKAAQPGWVKRGSVDSFLFNLGDPVARTWFCEQIAKLIRDNRIDYYRQDFNIDPEGFWYANDQPDRVGICEIRYIEGLYAFWDYLRAEFPGLVIDNCASGGPRIDLAVGTALANRLQLRRTDRLPMPHLRTEHVAARTRNRHAQVRRLHFPFEPQRHDHLQLEDHQRRFVDPRDAAPHGRIRRRAPLLLRRLLPADGLRRHDGRRHLAGLPAPAPLGPDGLCGGFPPRTLARRTESRAFPRTGTRSDLRVGKRRQRRPRGGHGPATDGRFHDEHRTAPLVVVDQIR